MLPIDSDNENSTLNRFHPDWHSSLTFADRRGLDGIFSALEKSNLVVMDCRAASTELFIDFFTQINLPAVLSALDAAITLVILVNHESDAVWIRRKNLPTNCAVENAAHVGGSQCRPPAKVFSCMKKVPEVSEQLKDKLGWQRNLPWLNLP